MKNFYPFGFVGTSCNEKWPLKVLNLTDRITRVGFDKLMLYFNPVRLYLNKKCMSNITVLIKYETN